MPVGVRAASRLPSGDSVGVQRMSGPSVAHRVNGRPAGTGESVSVDASASPPLHSAGDTGRMAGGRTPLPAPPPLADNDRPRSRPHPPPPIAQAPVVTNTNHRRPIPCPPLLSRSNAP